MIALSKEWRNANYQVIHAQRILIAIYVVHAHVTCGCMRVKILYKFEMQNNKYIIYNQMKMFGKIKCEAAKLLLDIR